MEKSLQSLRVCLVLSIERLLSSGQGLMEKLRDLQAILRNYRTTPHATTGVATAVLLLKRPVRNKVPQANHIDPVAEATPLRI